VKIIAKTLIRDDDDALSLMETLQKMTDLTYNACRSGRNKDKLEDIDLLRHGPFNDYDQESMLWVFLLDTGDLEFRPIDYNLDLELMESDTLKGLKEPPLVDNEIFKVLCYKNFPKGKSWVISIQETSEVTKEYYAKTLEEAKGKAIEDYDAGNLDFDEDGYVVDVSYSKVGAGD